MRMDQFFAEIGGYAQFVLIIVTFFIKPILKRLFTIEAAKVALEKQILLSKFQKSNMRELELYADTSYFRIHKEMQERENER